MKNHYRISDEYTNLVIEYNWKPFELTYKAEKKIVVNCIFKNKLVYVNGTYIFF